MITVFTLMLLAQNGSGLLPHSSIDLRMIVLGSLLGMYPFAQFIGSPILGAFSDNYGRKKILIFSLICSVIFYILISLSLQNSNIYLLFISIFFAVLSESNIGLVLSAIADIVGPEKRNQYFGYITLAASSAYIVGPILGGKLADPQLNQHFNYVTPFWCTTILIFFMLIYVALSFKDPLQKITHTSIHYIQALTNIKNIFTYKKVPVLFLCNFLLYLSIFGFFRSYSMYLVDHFHMNVSQVSNYVALVSAPILIVSLWLNVFFAKFILARNMILLSALLIGLLMMTVVIPQNRVLLGVALLLSSFFIALCMPATATLLSLSVNSYEQGAVMGNNQSLQFLAESLSGILGGTLATISVKLPMIILAIFALAACLILLLSHTTQYHKD